MICLLAILIFFFLWVASYSVLAQFLLGWVKICERSEVLPYLQAKNLACQFTNAGRSYEIPGLETKDFITYRITSSMSISIFTSILLGPSPTGVQMDLDGCLHTSSVEIDKPWAKEPRSFIMRSKHVCLWTGRKY